MNARIGLRTCDGTAFTAERQADGSLRVSVDSMAIDFPAHETSAALLIMIKRHLDGIVTAVVTRVTNARAESINAGVQKLKYSARGFRNRKRFRNAIYFHLGGLDLYPAGVDR